MGDMRGPKKPSMKRRCELHNYRERGIYMITMSTEGRRPLLGQLAGRANATEGADVPHVVLSPLGERVRDCWQDIPKYYPVVEPMKLCIMPDHIHGLLFVHSQMEKHLGHVIEGFKIGTRKAARELGLLPTRGEESFVPSPSTAPYTALIAQPPHPSRHTAAGRAHGLLWEPGYNDRLLTHKGQLQHMIDYLADNPRRLLLKRQHPEFFTRLGTITVANVPMEAMGNSFLLNYPVKRQVQCSRSLSSEEIEERKRDILQAGREGAVLVSPCISPGEQQITTAALQAGVPLIVLLLKGFPSFFKPQPRYLEACANGKLLMLAPFPWQNEKIGNMRQRCLQLNALAGSICG